MADENNNPTPQAGQEGIEGYPKKPNGDVDIEALSPEQAAKYWKDRSDGSTKSYQDEKTKREEAEKLLLEKETLLTSMGQRGADLEALHKKAAEAENLSEFEDLIPNFNDLSEEERNNVKTFYNNVEARVTKRFNNDPAIRHSRQVYAETKWDEAFNKVAPAIPGLAEKKAEFKKQYFNPDNVPENIENILTTLGKSYLFDETVNKAKEEGAEEERKRQNGFTPDGNTGGDKNNNAPGMSLDDWDYLARTKPQEFARRKAEFEADMAKGKLKE